RTPEPAPTCARPCRPGPGSDRADLRRSGVVTWAPPALVLLAALVWWWPGADLRSPVVVRPPTGDGEGRAGADLRRTGRRIGWPAPGPARSTGAGWAAPVAGLVGVLSRRREADRAERDLLRVLDALAAALRSGATPRAALAEAAEVTTGPLRADLSAVG